MELTLQRLDSDPYRTHGRLMIERDDFCVTLEDPLPHLLNAEDVSANKGCIPAGRYRVLLTVSPRARTGGLWTPWPDSILPLIEDVPGFEGIRIHAGNTASNTEGCILVGLSRTADAITSSRSALIRLKQELVEPCWITIINPEG
jgi:hypothetical protein